jgi:superfamily II DNA helicase RecQ
MLIFENMSFSFRPEIYLELMPKTEKNRQLEFLSKEFNQLGLGMEKTVVFVDTINATTELNVNLRRTLTMEGVVGINPSNNTPIYASEHFSSCTPKKAKERIIRDFQDPDGIIRILFCTISYGMGMDNKTIRRVILYDVDKRATAIWQKIGRACRDGEVGKAIFMLGKTGSKTGKNIIESGKCIRHAILSQLIGYTAKGVDADACSCFKAACQCIKCSCCSECRADCRCRSSEVAVFGDYADSSSDCSAESEYEAQPDSESIDVEFGISCMTQLNIN